MKYLTFLESIINKEYLSFDSIVKNKNLALLVNKVSSNKIDVICYDTSLIFDEFKSFIYRIKESDVINSIIFCGTIHYNKAPLDAISVDFAISHPKTSGINILYPLLALISKIYFNDGTIYSDHITGYTPSPDAQNVWNKFYSQDQWQLQKVIPIDDKKQKLTPSIIDDGKVHFKIEHPVIDYFKNKKGIYYLLNKLKKQRDDNLFVDIQRMINEINVFSKKQIIFNKENIDEIINDLKEQEEDILKDILYKFRSPVDWIFKLKEGNEINTSNVQLMIKRSDEFIKKSNWIKSKKDFAYDLKRLSDKYYISQEKYRIT
jgi:hypothetical protein